MTNSAPQKGHTTRRHFQIVAAVFLVAGLLVVYFDRRMGLNLIGMSVFTFCFSFIFSSDPNDQGSL